MFNHLEYETANLAEEYARDHAVDPRTPPPRYYFPEDTPNKAPTNRWRSHAHLLFGNWLNEIYQTTPFDLADIALQLQSIFDVSPSSGSLMGSSP